MNIDISIFSVFQICQNQHLFYLKHLIIFFRNISRPASSHRYIHLVGFSRPSGAWIVVVVVLHMHERGK